MQYNSLDKDIIYMENLVEKMVEHEAIIKGDYDKLFIDTLITFICQCGQEHTKKYKVIIKNAPKCPKCTKESKKLKTQQTNLKKYGKLYGFQNEEIKEKIKKTNLKNYGVVNCSQNADIRAKSAQTNLKKYGVEHSFQNLDVQTKYVQTILNKYGCKYPSQNKNIQNKIKTTFKEKYGCEHNMQISEVKKQMKINNLQKYGVEYPMQNPQIAESIKHKSYKLKSFQTPSNETIHLQGYEPFAYKLLLEKYTEFEIKYKRTEVPTVFWIDKQNIQHKYFVDFFIPKDNLMIEVKSKWTQCKNKEKIELTSKACIEAGFKFELWVFNDKGQMIQT